MSKPVKVTVNKSFQFDISPQDLNNLNIVTTFPNHYHILQDYHSVSGEIIYADFQNRTYTVLVNNTPYLVEISNDFDTLFKQLGFETSRNFQVKQVLAPMPGLILDIVVEEGQDITIDTPLLTLEAMKMENNILSPISGKIKSICVTSKSSVNKGDLLIEFE